MNQLHSKCDVLMRMVCESAARYICDGNDSTLNSTVFYLSVPYLGQEYEVCMDI
jgi:hypothetical protein